MIGNRRLKTRLGNAAGVTLVELLVVMVLLAAVGAIIASSIVGGLRADAQARDRIEALEDVQIALERVSRDVRAADPLLLAEPNEVRFRVLREDLCVRITYELDGTDLVTSQERYEADCVTFIGAGQDGTVLHNLDPNTDVFAFNDEDREPTASLSRIAFVEIRFIKGFELGNNPIEVRTVVGLRNR